VAFAGKFIGCSLGATLTGYKKERVAIGVAMCSRGALELAILRMGYEARIGPDRVVPYELFATMVVVVLILIVTTPILFKYASRGQT